jgi:hypothetical protein
VTTLEFWPDYGGVLLHDAGRAVALHSLDLPPELVTRASGWLARYDDARLEPGARDEDWIAEGQALFTALAAILRDRGIALSDWEGYWSTPDPG